MSKHTPGPWMIGSSDLKVSMLSVHCRDTKRKHSTICRMVSTKHGMDIFEGEANARLIAAAPELLEALKNLVLCSERWEDTHTALVMEAARAAIAKATS